MTQIANKLKLSRLLSFFLPLCISSSFVTISHVIINSTLARAPEPELVIAGYAIAMSIFGVTERAANLLRNTASAIVRDRVSFRSLAALTLYLIIGIVLIGLIISYTPIGQWLFLYVFGVDDTLLRPIIQNYQILMFVTIFTCIRCLYQGVIISNMRTKWLTIGMGIRLATMYALATYFIYTDQVADARVGAIIFLVGMAIEALVSFIEGKSLVKKMPKHIESHEYHTKREVFSFYRPLMFSSFISVAVAPAINSFLGKTTDIKLAIASYAIALSINQLVNSTVFYTHQIVLNFYQVDKKAVQRFTLIVSIIPCLLLGILSYTAIGPWFMQTVMGVSSELMLASLKTMRIFMMVSLIFPWLDFCNGLILLRGRTSVTVFSQSANLTITLTALIVLIALTPGWNGMIGALSLSLGMLAELAVLLFVLRTMQKQEVNHSKIIV